MRIFLTSKHWQLFVLLVGVPMVFEFFVIVFLILTRNVGFAFYVFPVIMAVFIGVFFGWFYSLGTNLYRKLPETQKMNLTTFKIFLFTPFAYISLIIAVILWIAITTPARDPINPVMLLFIIPMHLFCMFCIFYCLWFIAKSLKAAELQRPVAAGDYIGEFFLMWFYPVGIWFIQPRVNKLFEPAADSPPAIGQ